MQRLSRSLSMVLILIISGNISPGRAQDIVSAKWEAHQIRFRYSGFATEYTCDGIRSKLKQLLRAIGARDDVRIESNCVDSFSTEKFHRLLLAFAVPVPADEIDITEETFPAKWERVELRYRHPRNLGRGECELIEQFNRQVVSKIGARDVKKTACFPGRPTLNSVNLGMTLLIMQEEPEHEH